MSSKFSFKKCQVKVSFIFRKNKINRCCISLFNNKSCFDFKLCYAKTYCVPDLFTSLVVLANKNVLVNLATMLLEIKLLHLLMMEMNDEWHVDTSVCQPSFSNPTWNNLLMILLHWSSWWRSLSPLQEKLLAQNQPCNKTPLIISNTQCQPCFDHLKMQHLCCI
jgi:hypothetical protein